jgi:hypothetical protein
VVTPSGRAIPAPLGFPRLPPIPGRAIPRRVPQIAISANDHAVRIAHIDVPDPDGD